VLLGVVSSQDAVQSAGARARTVTGVKGVTNFLIVPEAEYESLAPAPPLRDGAARASRSGTAGRGGRAASDGRDHERDDVEAWTHSDGVAM
jgi:hypothetical protein